MISQLITVSRNLVSTLFLVQRGRHPYKWGFTLEMYISFTKEQLLVFFFLKDRISILTQASLQVLELQALTHTQVVSFQSVSYICIFPRQQLKINLMLKRHILR
jgi:hypothetical protein